MLQLETKEKLNNILDKVALRSWRNREDTLMASQ